MLGLSIGVLFFALGAYYFNQFRMRKFRIDYSQVPGKVYVVTGANSGLGYETTKELLRHGGKVIMGCRDLIRGEDAKQHLLVDIHSAHAALPKEIREKKPVYDYADNVQVMKLDLSSFNSIQLFADTLQDQNIRITGALINNAGIMALPTRQLTEDGLEAQIGTNHFGHFLLTMLLLPRMDSDARVINHASAAHALHAKGFPFEDVQSEAAYDPFTAYGNSKMANVLFTSGLQQRLTHAKSSIQAFAVHPGYSATHLQTNKFPLWEIANNYFAMSAADGALSQIYAAVDPRARNTDPAKNPLVYIGPEFVMFGAPRVQMITSSVGHNPSAIETLWQLSVKITKADFEPSFVSNH